MACNGLINAPLTSSSLPLYSIQYAATKRYPLYRTTRESIVVLATSDRLYYATTVELAQHYVISMRQGGLRLEGPDPEMRLDTAL